MLRGRYRPRGIMGVKQIIYNKVIPELGNLLSLTDPSDQDSGGPFDPEAKAVQDQSKSDLGDLNSPKDPSIAPKEATAPTEDSGHTPSQPTANALATLVSCQINHLAAASMARVHLALTAEDAGRLILFCYRRYSFRQRVTRWFAVRTIWAYYSRHRLRHKVTHTTTDDQIRRLHNEYKKDVEGIECPSLYNEDSRRHGQLLLGPMPHVAVYLRGLEQVNQRQKDFNKKQLQKVQHEALEKIQAKMNRCRYFFLRLVYYEILSTYRIYLGSLVSALSRTFRKLGPKIQPGQSVGSALHTIDSLKEKVREVDALRSAIIQAFGEGSIPASIEEHYWLGVNVILASSAEPNPPKPPKPDLNTSDLGDVF
jgi:hypothetical protein